MIRSHTCSLWDNKKSFVRRYVLERHRNAVHSEYTEYCRLKEESEMDVNLSSDHSESEMESSVVMEDVEEDDEGWRRIFGR